MLLPPAGAADRRCASPVLGSIRVCSQSLVLVGSRILQAPQVASSTARRVHGLVPGQCLEPGWYPYSGLKSPMILATLVLPLDFGGPGLEDQPSHKPKGGRGRSCKRELRKHWHPRPPQALGVQHLRPGFAQHSPPTNPIPFQPSSDSDREGLPKKPLSRLYQGTCCGLLGLVSVKTWLKPPRAACAHGHRSPTPQEPSAHRGACGRRWNRWGSPNKSPTTCQPFHSQSSHLLPSRRAALAGN